MTATLYDFEVSIPVTVARPRVPTDVARDAHLRVTVKATNHYQAADKLGSLLTAILRREDRA